MNQILITEKLYITPELKKKKKIYKFYFFLSVFLICILVSFYIYAEYDRTKSEEVSQSLLSDVVTDLQENSESIDNTTIKMEDNILVVVLGENEEDNVDITELTNENNSAQTTQEYKASDGQTYNTVGVINIPKINVNYPILSETSDALLKVAPCKFWGPNANEVGNFCIAGHNYRNSKFFSKVPTLENGDKIEITDLKGRTITYEVYTKYIVDPYDVSCTSQLTDGRKDITLITCTNDNKQRVIVKATEVK